MLEFMIAAGLVFNGSFELGTAGLSCTRTLFRVRNPRYVYTPLATDTDRPFRGTRCLRLHSPYGETTTAVLRELCLEPDVRYVVSFAARARCPGTGVSLKLGSWDYVDANRTRYQPGKRQDDHRKAFALGEDWQTFRYAFRTRGGDWKNPYYDLSFDTAGEVFLDDVRVVREDAVEVPPPPGLQAAFVPHETELRRDDGTTVLLPCELRVWNGTTNAVARALSVVGRDADTRETFWRQDFAVTLAAGETRTVAVDVPIRAFGPWQFAVEGADDAQPGYVTVFARSLRPKPDLERDFSLGIHGGVILFADPLTQDPKSVGVLASDRQIDDEFAVYRDAGIRFFRQLGSRDGFQWAFVEREPGKYAFEHADWLVDYYAHLGLQILPCIGRFGAWNPKSPVFPPWVTNRLERLERQGWNGQAVAYVPPMNLWSNYVAQMVRHFDGRIKYWEICNEPNDLFRPFSRYLDILKATYPAIRTASKGARLLGFCSTGDLGNDPQAFLAECFRQGGLDFCDAVSFHPYNAQSYRTTPKGPSRVRADEQIAAVRANMRKAGREVPLWNTECFFLTGCEGPAEGRLAHSPHHVAWRALTDLACGVRQSCFMLIEGLHRNPVNPHTDTWISRRPHVFSGDLVALNMVARTLQGATPVETVHAGGVAVVHLFRAAEGRLLASAWFYGDGRGAVVDIPPEVGRLTDLYGNAVAERKDVLLGARPIYLFPRAEAPDGTFAEAIRRWAQTHLEDRCHESR